MEKLCAFYAEAPDDDRVFDGNGFSKGISREIFRIK